MHLKAATHSYSAEAASGAGRTGAALACDWAAYQSTASIPDGMPALLHSLQREADFEKVSGEIYGTDLPEGAVYGEGSSGTHDMRTNSAWLLGLAHHGKKAVMTTPIDNETIIRRSARSQTPVLRNTEDNLSGLARELIGMTQGNHFAASTAPDGLQWLEPTPLAKAATLNDFKTPAGLPKEMVIGLLDIGGVDTSRIDRD